MGEKIWMVVGVMDDIQVFMGVASTWKTALELAYETQGELAQENNHDDEEVVRLHKALVRAVTKKLDDGRYRYCEVEDDLGITWRFKQTYVITRT